MLPKLLRANEVAETLDISRSYAYKLLQSGQIPSVHIGKCRRVRAEDLEDFIDSSVNPQNPISETETMGSIVSRDIRRNYD